MSETRRLGRYLLDRRIATGGMAEIWLAHQEGPAGFAKQIVIKRILAHLADDQKFVEMFLDEARLAAQLSHPNIGQIFDLGHVDGQYFIAMEYIDGWDLERIIQRAAELGRAIPAEVCARIIADACTALDYAHSWTDPSGTHAGLVHRDVSPQNILVTRSGVVKLVDFGVAKARTSSHKTQTGAVKGKLSYMSPEQITAKELDGRSDIFALGIVLYEVLTTQRPFGHESELLAVTSILNETQRRARELNAEVPDALESVIEKALMKRRDDRFGTAGEMQVALEHALHAMGRVLTSKDVGAYLQDLFSENPSLQWAARLPSSPRARLQAGADTTLPHHQASRETGVLGDRSSYSEHDDDVPKRSGKGVLFAAIFVVLTVIGAGGFGLWTWVIQPALRGAPETETASTVERIAEGTNEVPSVAEPVTQTGAAPVEGAHEAALAALGEPSPPQPVPSPPEPTQETNTTALEGPADTEGPPPEGGPDGANDEAKDNGPDASALAETAGDPPTGSDLRGDSGPDAPTPQEDPATAESDGPAEPPEDLPSGPPDLPSDAATDGATQADPDDGTVAVAETPNLPPETSPTSDTGEQRRVRDRDSEPRRGSDRSERGGRTGTVLVVIQNGQRSTVYAGSRNLGQVTGSRRFELATGQHTLRVVGENGAESTHPVQVEEGQVSRVSVR